MGHIGAQLVGNVHRVQAGLPPGLQAGGPGNQGLPLGWGEEGDGGVLGYGDGLAVAVDGHGEGKVRQGENRAAHGRSIGIEQLRPQGQGTDRGAGLGLLDENAGCLGSVAIPGKTGADIVKCRHRGSFLLEIRIFQWTAGPG